MTTYYVGPGEAYETIAAAFAAITGDQSDNSILLQRGATFNETCTINCYGTSGHPLTIGAYGAGNNPILNNLDTVTGWSPAGGSSSSTWSRSESVADAGASTNVNRRVLISGATVSGSQIQVSFQMYGGGGKIAGAAIGERSGSSPDFTTTPTRITFDSGANYHTFAVAGTVASDWITFAFDYTKTYMVSFFIDGTTSHPAERNLTASDYRYDSSSDESQTANVVDGNYTPLRNYEWCVTNIQVQTPSTAYSASLTTECKAVWDGDTQLTLNNGALGGVALGQWDWASNTLYVNLGEDPSTHTITVSQPGTCINFGGNSYINLENVSVRGGQLASDDNQADGGGILIKTPCSNINCTNITITKCHGGGFRILGATYVTIDGFTVSNIEGNAPTPGTYGDGVSVNWKYDGEVSPTDITIKNGTINTSINRQGIVVQDCETLLIDTCVVNAGRNAIDLEPNPSTNQAISDAIVRNCTVDLTVGSGLYGLTISEPTCSNILFDNNTVNLNNTGSGTGVIVWNGVSGIIVRRTIISGCTLGIKTNGGGDNLLLDRNKLTAGSSPSYAIDCAGTGTSNKINYNLIIGAWEAGIYMEGTAVATIYNNTFYQNVLGIGSAASASNTTAKNNIFHSSSTRHVQKATACTWVSNYNDFYPDTGTLFNWQGDNYNFADWKTNSSQDGNSINSDPLLVNPSTNCQLQSGSPCINAGVDVSLTQDYAGNSIIGNPDIGAYESITGGVLGLNLSLSLK